MTRSKNYDGLAVSRRPCRPVTDGGAPNGGVHAPLFVLAPPRSFTSVVCAMLGQHPELYGLPEVHLFTAETVAERLEMGRRTPTKLHGLLRVVAELFLGGQTRRNVRAARAWLRDRADLGTGELLETFAAKVAPRRLVDKSPSTTRSLTFLHRARRMFPQARFLHLVRHPRGQGESVMKLIQAGSRNGQPPRWLLRFACPDRSFPDRAESSAGSVLDPQQSWYERQFNIQVFLGQVPDRQQMRIRGEDLMKDLDTHLRAIMDWLGLRSDAAAIEAMKHPERSPFACFGPRGARLGNDRLFMRDPVLRPWKGEKAHTLEGPLGWRPDGGGFMPEVRNLAEQFGYE